MREVCLDTETTGFYAKSGDRIIDIGCVELTRYGLSDRIFHKFIDPQRNIPDEVIKVHGITNEMVAGKPKFEEIVDEFLEFVGGARLIIHNAPFDVGFLDEELRRCGREPLSEYVAEIVDSLEMAKNRYPGQHNSLDALCNRFNIDLSVRSKHGAYIDARLLGQVYLKLRQSQSSFELNSSSSSGTGVRFTGDASALPVIKASEEEIEAHENYLNGMEKKLKHPSYYRMGDEEFEQSRLSERESLRGARKKIEDIIKEI